LENLEEINKFLGTHDNPKFKTEDINHLNRSIICNEIEAELESPKNEKLQIGEERIGGQNKFCGGRGKE
jgi:hypothetical protein